jgi:hypothetical protein
MEKKTALIAAAIGAIVSSCLCGTLYAIGWRRAFGPAAAGALFETGAVLTWVAGALFGALGALFPFKDPFGKKTKAEPTVKTEPEPTVPANNLEKRPRTVWIASTLVLLAACVAYDLYAIPSGKLGGTGSTHRAYSLAITATVVGVGIGFAVRWLVIKLYKRTRQ